MGRCFVFPMRNNTAMLIFATLFNTVLLDVLAGVIKQERKIKDFQIRNENFKLFMIVDNMIL